MRNIFVMPIAMVPYTTTEIFCGCDVNKQYLDNRTHLAERKS